ncbi:hypothetical protein HELRODRAFT_171411 [Helobdella robusta]|uniref:EF-hand domain-containing protein n=1 Tax=Helobdella robusta TaxID=6412 RepID=T1F490_HELRO|nr:hypothetical protein HELRODRAFT_171411 [Helobdella robusta]ESO05743.1 hypothetical protein HELRODRAFT_171411 [Helobdella robusta]
MTSRHKSAAKTSEWKEGRSNAGYDDEDMMPTGMDTDVYSSKKDYKNDPSNGNMRLSDQKAQNSDGCLHAIKRGFRSIWATKQTEETAHNQDLRIKTTLRELVIYCVFLAILCIITFGMTSSTMYYYTNVMNSLFIQTPGDPSNLGSNFLGINLPGDLFDVCIYAEKVLLPGLYRDWETWYNNNTMDPDIYGYIYYENKLQGVPRLRQVRVRNDSCRAPDNMKNQIKDCYAAYSSSAEDTRPYGLGIGTAWTHSNLGSNVRAQINSYGGGGYYADLNTTGDLSEQVIDNLKTNLWVDRGTRAVFIDFTIYNANINLFCVIKLIAEFPPTGGIIPSYDFRTVKLIRYNTAFDFFVFACEIIFCIFILYYIGEEFLEIKKYKWSYLKEFWNVLDIVVICISLCCIAFNIYRFLEVKKLLDYMLLNPNVYIDFDYISYWQSVFNSALAIMVFFAWIKIFKYISFNKTMTQLSSTLGACAKDLGGFSIMFFIVFLAFAQLGYLLFGAEVSDFNAYETAIFTLFRIILGDFNFQALQQANSILGPTYFILYVFFVFFVLLNMFLAIINDTYSEVKAELADQPNDIDVAGYFKQRANNVLTKLHLRKNKIIEIQRAITTADANGDRMIDFDEWRHDLKMRGYAEAEIEAVFAKYDINGDRLLDESELYKMQADLEGQKGVQAVKVALGDKSQSC